MAGRGAEERAEGIRPGTTGAPPCGSKLCYGVCQNRLLLEFWLSKFSKVKPEKLEPAVRIALLLAMYQITMLDKIPPRAAVNESVNLARRNSKNPRSPTLVNGILRSFCRAQENLPQPDDLATRYSHPQWLVDLLSQEIPAAELESLLASNNAEPPTTIQTNTTKITPDALAETLAAQGVTVETHPWLDGCFTLRGTGDLEQLKAFRDGLFLVQDTASRLVVLAAQPEAGQHILDACGAPAEKVFPPPSPWGTTVPSCPATSTRARSSRLQRAPSAWV